MRYSQKMRPMMEQDIQTCNISDHKHTLIQRDEDIKHKRIIKRENSARKFEKNHRVTPLKQ